MKTRISVLKRLSAAISFAAIVGISLLGMSFAHDGEGKTVTLKGEVVDLQCYMVHPETSMGPDHAKCAKACMKKGLPVGFVAEDGKLYLLIGPGHDTVKSLVADKAGQTITLKGTLLEQNGMQALQLKKEGEGHH